MSILLCMISPSLNSDSSTLEAIHFLTKGREVAWIWYWRGGQKFRILSCWSFMNGPLHINNWWKISNVPKHPVETVASLLDPHPPSSHCPPACPVHRASFTTRQSNYSVWKPQGILTKADERPQVQNPLKLCGHKDTTQPALWWQWQWPYPAYNGQ